MHNETIKITNYPLWRIALRAVDINWEKKDARFTEDEWKIKRRYRISIYLII